MSTWTANPPSPTLYSYAVPNNQQNAAGRPSYYAPTPSLLATDLAIGARTSHQPTAEPNVSRAGYRVHTFGMDDWYYRVHISASSIALGNVVTNVVETIKVWNAWLDRTQTLTSLLSSNADGITVAPPGSLPLTFLENQELSWGLTIGVSGPPVIAAQFSWAFADGETLLLAITGSRITAWALTPDWGVGVRETLEFKTDVLTAWSGAEQRRALRIAPRRYFDFESMLGSQERRYLEAQLFAWSARIWALPIFSDGQRIASALTAGATTIPCDTVNRDFVAGGLAMLITDAAHYEVAQVLSVFSNAIALASPLQNNWPQGTRLYPGRAARLSEYPKLTRENGTLSVVKPRFVTNEPCDWPAATGLPSYRTYPVLENSPDESQGAEASYERLAVTIDNDTGVVEIDDPAAVSFPQWVHEWFMQGRTARAAFRSLMYLLKGRQGEIWVPSYLQDLKVVTDITAITTHIDVETTGYTLYLVGQVNRQDIRIEMTNGTIFYRRIVAASVVDVNTERLQIDSQLGQAVAVSQIRRVSYMTLCRLGDDAVEIQHINGDTGLATAATQFRATNHNV